MPEIPENLKDCTWPDLPALYDSALHQAVKFILAPDDSLVELRKQAAVELTRTPDPTPQQLTITRYWAATRYEDATDIAQTKPETADMVLGQAVYAMLHYAFFKANCYIPRDKDLRMALAGLDAQLAHKTTTFYRSPAFEERFALA